MARQVILMFMKEENYYEIYKYINYNFYNKLILNLINILILLFIFL